METDQTTKKVEWDLNDDETAQVDLLITILRSKNEKAKSAMRIMMNQIRLELKRDGDI